MEYEAMQNKREETNNYWWRDAFEIFILFFVHVLLNSESEWDKVENEMREKDSRVKEKGMAQGTSYSCCKIHCTIFLFSGIFG